jgi:aspartyl-tRNA(Asn)/glutamyl-tRNA(Gln) amidotransferase subunit B
MIENGETIIQQTRSFNADNDTTFAIRDKEDANDYRYFPDPDLAPFHLTDEYIQEIANALPALPNQLKKHWKETLGLNNYDIEQLCENKQEADFYAKWIEQTKHYKAAANWILGPIRELVHEEHASYESLITLLPYLSELLQMVDEGKVNFSIASSKIFKEIVKAPQSPLQYATEHNLLQTNSTDEIEAWVDQVLESSPEKVAEYKKGKKGLIGVFIGDVKKISKGKADPKITTKILEEKLSK